MSRSGIRGALPLLSHHGVLENWDIVIFTQQIAFPTIFATDAGMQEDNEEMRGIGTSMETCGV
jgi:hypothetical protein